MKTKAFSPWYRLLILTSIFIFGLGVVLLVSLSLVEQSQDVRTPAYISTPEIYLANENMEPVHFIPNEPGVFRNYYVVLNSWYYPVIGVSFDVDYYQGSLYSSQVIIDFQNEDFSSLTSLKDAGYSIQMIKLEPGFATEQGKTIILGRLSAAVNSDAVVGQTILDLKNIQIATPDQIVYGRHSRLQVEKENPDAITVQGEITQREMDQNGNARVTYKITELAPGYLVNVIGAESQYPLQPVWGEPRIEAAGCRRLRLGEECTINFSQENFRLYPYRFVFANAYRIEENGDVYTCNYEDQGNWQLSSQELPIPIDIGQVNSAPCFNYSLVELQ